MKRPDDPFRQDSFLGGRLSLWQPTRGYRSGIDAVLMAAACPARTGQRVLDVGCGAGVAMYCLGARVVGLSLTGVEIQPQMAELARRNAVENGQFADVFAADITQPPEDLVAISFDHAILNPPYFQRHQGPSAPDRQRETSMGEETPLHDLIRATVRRLKPKGSLTIVHRAERLDALLRALGDAGMGEIAVLPLLPRRDRPARLVLIRARKGVRGPLSLRPPMVLHSGDTHGSDGDDYTPQISAVLRDGVALPGFD